MSTWDRRPLVSPAGICSTQIGGYVQIGTTCLKSKGQEGRSLGTYSGRRSATQLQVSVFECAFYVT